MSRPFVEVNDTKTESYEEIKQAIIEQVRSGCDKPWTVVSRVADDGWKRNEVRETLRQLTLNGEVTPTIDGNLREHSTEE